MRITSERIYKAILEAFRGFAYQTIMVTCDIEVLRKRELQRGDRYIGSSEASIEYLYPKDHYDLVVNSSYKTPDLIAEEILKRMDR